MLNFMWHERWTWRDRPVSTSSERWQRLARFNALTGAHIDRRNRGHCVHTGGRILAATRDRQPHQHRRARRASISSAPTRWCSGASPPSAMLAIALTGARVRRGTAAGEDGARLCEVCRGRRGAAREGHHRPGTVPRYRASTAGAAGADDGGAQARRGDRHAWRGARCFVQRNRNRRRADQPLARDGVRAERHRRSALEGPAGAADRQAQAGRRAVVARHLARRAIRRRCSCGCGGPSSSRWFTTRNTTSNTGGCRPIARSATASRPRWSRSRTPARPRSAPCPRATITATCGGSIPTGATSRSTAACWSRSSR